jgi:predicted 3-demethylubiquinone-9 3-methyltransferase (glyoxalase superfamily)
MITVDKQPRLTHEVLIRDKSNVEVERLCTWCHEQFGIRFSIVDRPVEQPTFGRDGVWQCIYDGFLRDRVPAYKFSFDHEKDAVLFALRWC